MPENTASSDPSLPASAAAPTAEGNPAPAATDSNPEGAPAQSGPAHAPEGAPARAAEGTAQAAAEAGANDLAEPADESSAAAAAAATPAASPQPPGMSPAACGDALRRLFPALFDGPIRPLKLRIQADIQARAPGQFSKTVLSAFLRRYTGSTGYLVALTRSRQRVDLDGAPAGELADEHRQAAVDELARRRALVADRRAAEDAQRQQRFQLLRDFERTTLTPANFCALKGLSPEALDAQLAQARAEAAEPRRDDGSARRDGPRPHRRDDAPRRDGPRHDGPRPPRHEGAGRPDGPRPPGPRKPR